MLIKRNRNIQHLNLTDCMLTNNVMIAILDQIYKSLTLQAVHLCENPGLLDNRTKNTYISLFGENPKSMIEFTYKNTSIGL